MRVLFDNTTDFNLDEDLIKKVIKASLDYEGIKDDTEVSFTLTDNDTIHMLNKNTGELTDLQTYFPFP